MARPTLAEVVDLPRYPLQDDDFRHASKRALDQHGVLVLHEFLLPATIAAVRAEAEANRHLAYYTANKHNIYLAPPDPAFTADHPRNREVASSKGCITTDQVPLESALRVLYDASQFRDYLCAVLGEERLYEYADPLSSINIHYADEQQELGWHYDNSAFAITLMIQPPEEGGVFEYVKDVRTAERDDMAFDLSAQVLNSEVPAETLVMAAGTLVLFRGRDSMHRVTPVRGARTRILVVLAYNTEPGVSLSASARMTFFGRLA